MGKQVKDMGEVTKTCQITSEAQYKNTSYAQLKKNKKNKKIKIADKVLVLNQSILCKAKFTLNVGLDGLVLDPPSSVLTPSWITA